MNDSMLNQFRISVNEDRLNVYGVVVYQKGKKEASHRWRADTRECLYSGSKTFTSMAVGIAQDEGRLKITDKLIDFFPEYKSAASEGSENITLRDLLHMSSGKELMWFDDNGRMDKNGDYAEQFLKFPLKWKPGEFFFYSNACTYMLGRVVEKLSGETVRDYLMPRLFDVLDIYNPQWHCCAQGHTICGTGLYLTTEEYSRLGKLLLNEGVWDDKRVVSAEYIRQSHTDMVSSSHFHNNDPESCSGYGFQVWQCTRDKDTYRADGAYAQFSIVMPDKDAVVTVTSHRRPNANDILRAVWKDIVPCL